MMDRLSDSLTIVWFKRDLRLTDHAPLAQAVGENKPVLLLYIFEPDLLKDPHYDARHWRFVRQSLDEMSQKLRDKNLTLHTVVGDPLDIFEKLNKWYGIDKILSHEETGIAKTFDRDKAVKRWCRAHGVAWDEHQTNAVVRGLMHRNDWRKRWRNTMRAEKRGPCLDDLQTVALSGNELEKLNESKLPFAARKDKEHFQKGGSDRAWHCLKTFIKERGEKYNKTISKPLESRTGCSRLSPHITWGTISLREVYQYLRKHYEQSDFKWQLRSFESRLRWHCHFIQKFETEPRIEFENMNRGYDDIRTEKNQDFIEAWKSGQTGFPLVDACMRCVEQTGYINFRMRAMLVSFLTHHLWQDWRHGAVHLGRCFLDFEPGIHYCQFQMQAGTLGPNSVRVYNPVKQGRDHDPEGTFIKQWVPELRDIPGPQIHEPWALSRMEQEMFGCKIGRDYPLRLVDHKKTYKRANKILWSKKSESLVKKENRRIKKKHVKPRRG